MYTIKLAINSLDGGFKYEQALNYIRLLDLKYLLDTLESIYKGYHVTYQIPSPFFDYIRSEDQIIDGSYSITAMTCNVNTKGVLFVMVRKTRDKEESVSLI